MQFNEQKTTGDCRLRWENHLHPSVYRGPWSKEEEKKLMKVANQHHCTDWKAIAEEVGVSEWAGGGRPLTGDCKSIAIMHDCTLIRVWIPLG